MGWWLKTTRIRWKCCLLVSIFIQIFYLSGFLYEIDFGILTLASALVKYKIAAPLGIDLSISERVPKNCPKPLLGFDTHSHFGWKCFRPRSCLITLPAGLCRGQARLLSLDVVTKAKPRDSQVIVPSSPNIGNGKLPSGHDLTDHDRKQGCSVLLGSFVIQILASLCCTQGFVLFHCSGWLWPPRLDGSSCQLKKINTILFILIHFSFSFLPIQNLFYT